VEKTNDSPPFKGGTPGSDPVSPLFHGRATTPAPFNPNISTGCSQPVERKESPLPKSGNGKNKKQPLKQQAHSETDPRLQWLEGFSEAYRMCVVQQLVDDLQPDHIIMTAVAGEIKPLGQLLTLIGKVQALQSLADELQEPLTVEGETAKAAGARAGRRLCNLLGIRDQLSAGGPGDSSAPQNVHVPQHSKQSASRVITAKNNNILTAATLSLSGHIPVTTNSGFDVVTIKGHRLNLFVNRAIQTQMTLPLGKQSLATENDIQQVTAHFAVNLQQLRRQLASELQSETRPHRRQILTEAIELLNSSNPSARVRVVTNGVLVERRGYTSLAGISPAVAKKGIEFLDLRQQNVEPVCVSVELQGTQRKACITEDDKTTILPPEIDRSLQDPCLSTESSTTAVRRQHDGFGAGDGNGKKQNNSRADNQQEEGGQKQGAQDKRLSKGEIKQLKKSTGETMHVIKGEILFGEDVAKYDLYKNADGEIVIKRKGAEDGPGEPTGYTTDDLKPPTPTPPQKPKR